MIWPNCLYQKECLFKVFTWKDFLAAHLRWNFREESIYGWNGQLSQKRADEVKIEAERIASNKDLIEIYVEKKNYRSLAKPQLKFW